MIKGTYSTSTLYLLPIFSVGYAPKLFHPNPDRLETHNAQLEPSRHLVLWQARVNVLSTCKCTKHVVVYQVLYLARENLADSERVIIPYKAAIIRFMT